MNHTCVIRTNRIYGGGSAYEHQVYRCLKKDYDTRLWEYNDSIYRYLKYNKFKIIAQTLLEHPRNADYLITNNLFIYGLRLNKFNKKILILHHINQGCIKSKKINNYIEKKILNSLNRFDAIVAVSNYWKKEIKQYTNKPIYVIFNSFDIRLIYEVIYNFDVKKFKHKYNLPDSKPIIYCGNSTYAKGIDIVSNYIDYNKYFIVTSGAKGLDFGQHHLNLSYSDYLRLLSISDCSVLLSRMMEGWNRIAHESVLCGTPVIGRPIAGLGELLEVSRQERLEDAINLNQVIEKVIANKELYTKAGKEMLVKYNLKYFRNEWVNLLNEI